MAKRKRGLHKEITSIFDGVPMPKAPQGQDPAAAPPHQSPQPAGAGADKAAPPPRAPRPPAKAAKAPLPPRPKQQAVKSTPKVIATEQPLPEAQIVGSAEQPGWQQMLETVKDKLSGLKSSADGGKQMKMAAMIPVLLIVLVIVFAKVLKGPKGTTVVPTEQTQTTAAAAVTEVDWQIPKPYPTNLRDPMRFGAVPIVYGNTGQAEGGHMPLKGILYSQDNPAAVIGTEIVYEGQVISGVRVAKINPDSVEFEKGDKKWTQEVQP
ncbi:MAG: hypothetical protein ACYSX1_12945 [Planctomycetota bacterium]|jgi:hypothetical protein